jgi:hypothetical protein
MIAWNDDHGNFTLTQRLAGGGNGGLINCSRIKQITGDDNQIDSLIVYHSGYCLYGIQPRLPSKDALVGVFDASVRLANLPVSRMDDFHDCIYSRTICVLTLGLCP